MQNPTRLGNQHKTISEETVDRVLSQRKAETEPNDDNGGRMISLKMPHELIKRCEKMAKAKNLTRSGFIKLALTEYLDAHENKA